MKNISYLPITLKRPDKQEASLLGIGNVLNLSKDYDFNINFLNISSKIASKRQQEIIASHQLLKNTWEKYHQREISDESFTITRSILGYKTLEVSTADHISTSHKDGVILSYCGKMSHPIEIDMELVPDRLEKTRENAYLRYIDESELELFKGKEGLYEEQLATLWSVKESLSKVIRLGLSASPEVYRICEIKKEDDREFICYFKNIYSLKSHVFHNGKWVIAFCLPKLTELNIDKKSLFNLIDTMSTQSQ